MARRNGARNRMGNQQIETLISYMEQHSLMARGQICKLGPQGNIKYKKMWNDLSKTLNCIGPAQKDVASWQKSWTKLRLTAKSNKAKFIKALSKTGHNAPDFVLSDHDQRITQIFGKYGTDMNLGKELGFHRNNFEDDDFHYNSLLYIDTKSLVTVQLQRYLIDTSLRRDNSFDELSNHVNQLYQNYVENKNKIQQKKPTDAQIKCLIDFMERHPDLANGVAENESELWTVLLSLLNNTKGVLKPERAWRKTWAGLVTAARQSMRFLLDGRKETAMSNNHIRIIDIVGYKEEQFSSLNKTTVLNSCQPSSCQYGNFDRSSASSALNPTPSPSNRSWYESQPSTSSGCSSYRSSTNMNWYDRLSTSSIFSNQSTRRGPPAATTTLSEEPPAKKRSVNPSILGFTVEPPRRAPSTTVEKSKMLEALQNKGSELIDTLSKHLTSCFEKQNEALIKGLEGLSKSLIEVMSKIISEEFKKVAVNKQASTVESLLETNDDVNGEEVFELVEESLTMDANVPADVCPICQDNKLNPKKMECCQHTFCKDCIEMWLQHSNCCPICRKSTFTWDELELQSDSEL